MNIRLADESDFPLISSILKNTDPPLNYVSVFFNQFNINELTTKQIISKRRIRGIIFSQDLDWVIIEKNSLYSLLVIQYPLDVVQTSAVSVSLAIFDQSIEKIDLSGLFSHFNSDITKISFRANNLGRRVLERFLQCRKEAEISHVSNPEFYYAVLKGEKYQ